MRYHRSEVDDRRVATLASGRAGRGPVVYWMDRDRRVHDNWAFIHAQDIARSARCSFLVVTCVDSEATVRTARRVSFLLQGLREIERECSRLRVPFVVLTGEQSDEIVQFVKAVSAGALITDFAVLRSQRAARSSVADAVEIPMYEVDAHNIVPARFVSPKQEWAAYTIRRKTQRYINEFLTEYPVVRTHPVTFDGDIPSNNWDMIERRLSPDLQIQPVVWAEGGPGAGRAMLDRFVTSRLGAYHEGKNDPTREVQSDLSPWLNFGFLSAQRVALDVQRYDTDIRSQEAFLEELIVRRELSDNFCFYNDHYDSVNGFPEWARLTLAQHRSDPREYVYTREQFELGRTHDPLWNAAQREMVNRGKMHGYMRMYWAKKILEWSATPEDALQTAIYLNDRYELDGCDPNGYTGIAWSIGGVHDRPWFEREVFGKVRYMSFGGCRRKFDVNRYIRTMEETDEGLPR